MRSTQCADRTRPGPSTTCDRPALSLNSARIRANTRAPLLQKAAHRRVGLQQDRLRIGGIRACPPTESGQQVGPRCPVRLIRDQALIRREVCTDCTAASS
jgi:hypothetical protein